MGGISGSGARPRTAAAEAGELPWGADSLKPGWTAEVEPRPRLAGLVVGAWPAEPAAWALEPVAAVAAVAVVAFIAAAVWVVPAAFPVAAEPTPVCVKVLGPEEGTEPRTPSLTTRGGAAEGLRWVPWFSNQRHLTGQGRRGGEASGEWVYRGTLTTIQKPTPWALGPSRLIASSLSSMHCSRCSQTSCAACLHPHPPPPPSSPPPPPPPVPSTLDA